LCSPSTSFQPLHRLQTRRFIWSEIFLTFVSRNKIGFSRKETWRNFVYFLFREIYGIPTKQPSLLFFRIPRNNFGTKIGNPIPEKKKSENTRSVRSGNERYRWKATK
jgi:hypothetical protein